MNKSLLVSALFSLSTILVPSQVAVNAATDTAVLDLDGKKLELNNSYYILPVFRGRGGGLTLGMRHMSCPLNVAQEDFELSSGLPVIFISVEPEDQFVELSKDMNFVFSIAATICVQPTVWRLSTLDEATGRRYVTTNGVVENPGIETLSNWFKIDRYNNDYKLVFCPTVCDFCKPVCGDVGVFVEDGRRWLGLTDVPFPVMFRKA